MLAVRTPGGLWEFRIDVTATSKSRSDPQSDAAPRSPCIGVTIRTRQERSALLGEVTDEPGTTGSEWCDGIGPWLLSRSWRPPGLVLRPAWDSPSAAPGRAGGSR
jgi:hypothetical protein